MTSRTGNPDNMKIPPHFDLEMYKMARKHAQMMITRINTAAVQKRLAAKSQPKPSPVAKNVAIAKVTVLDNSNDSNESEVEVTPPKKRKNAGHQFGHKGCQKKD